MELILIDKDEIIYSSEDLEVKNVRKNGMVPGIDLATKVRFLVVNEGDYYVKLFTNEFVHRLYPLKLNYVEVNHEAI